MALILRIEMLIWRSDFEAAQTQLLDATVEFMEAVRIGWIY